MANKKDSKLESVSGNHGITRRKAVKTIAGGVSALAAYHTLPVNWSTPIIEQIFLPAHAQTSGANVPVDPTIPVGPGHPNDPDFPHPITSPNHPHNQPFAVISNIIQSGGVGVLLDFDVTYNRIVTYTIRTYVEGFAAEPLNVFDYTNTAIPTTRKEAAILTSPVPDPGDTVIIEITNNLTSEVDTARYVVQGVTPTVSITSTPACGSTITSGGGIDLIAFTVTITPNPGAGQQVSFQTLINGSPDSSFTRITNASGIVSETLGASVNETLRLEATYQGASAGCEITVVP